MKLFSASVAFVALASLLAIAPAARAMDASQATAVRLITMPGPDGSLQLVDVGVMPTMLEKGTMMILCDAQCQGVLHLVGKPAMNGESVAMGVTLYVDAHSTAARLLGGH